MKLFKNKIFLIVAGIIFLSLSIWEASYTLFNFEVERLNITKECLEDTISFEKIDGDYAIEEKYSACQKDTDCSPMITACSPCCPQSVGINSVYIDEYVGKRALHCEKYHKSFCYMHQEVHCSCMVREMTTRCVDNKCVMARVVDEK